MTQPEGLKDREQRAREFMRQRSAGYDDSPWIGRFAAFAESEVAALEAKLAEAMAHLSDALSANDGHPNMCCGQCRSAIAKAERERDEARGILQEWEAAVRSHLCAQNGCRKVWLKIQGHIQDLRVAFKPWGVVAQPAEHPTGGTEGSGSTPDGATSQLDAALADAARLRDAIVRMTAYGKNRSKVLYARHDYGTDHDPEGCFVCAALASTHASDWLEQRLKAERERTIRQCEEWLELRARGYPHPQRAALSLAAGEMPAAIRALDGEKP